VLAATKQQEIDWAKYGIKSRMDVVKLVSVGLGILLACFGVYSGIRFLRGSSHDSGTLDGHGVESPFQHRL
jgi:hypothetical protein